MTMGDPPPRILLVGAADVGTHALAAAICGRALAEGASLHPWRLDTKYYTADVVLDVKHLASAPPAAAARDAYEAAVLVFTAVRPDSFASLQQWWGSTDAEDLPIRLAVATACERPRPGAERPAWLEEAEQWCRERLIELVEVGNDEPEGAGLERGIEEEKTGAPRVIEVLQAHMWPGLQLKRAAGSAEVLEPGSAGGAVAARSAGGSASFQDFLNDEAVFKATWPDDDPDVAAVERAFEEVSAARQQLQAQAGLSDGERRAGAAVAVQRLMAALGMEDSEGEGDSDSVSDDGPAGGAGA